MVPFADQVVATPVSPEPQPVRAYRFAAPSARVAYLTQTAAVSPARAAPIAPSAVSVGVPAKATPAVRRA
eukprot:1382028-Lingulodinium_polyedra.AAC.1